MRHEGEKLLSSLGGIGAAQAPDGALRDRSQEGGDRRQEANKLGIPVVAVVDTNCDPDRSDRLRSRATTTRIRAIPPLLRRGRRGGDRGPQPLRGAAARRRARGAPGRRGRRRAGPRRRGRGGGALVRWARRGQGAAREDPAPDCSTARRRSGRPPATSRRRSASPRARPRQAARKATRAATERRDRRLHPPAGQDRRADRGQLRDRLVAKTPEFQQL